MPSSAALEKRIRSLHEIESIVGAMKAYAGVAVRKAEEAVRNIRVCEENLLDALALMAAHHPGFALDPLREGKRIVVAFGSSVGMCGIYNQKVVQAIAKTCSGDDCLYLIGRRLHLLAQGRQIACAGHLESPASIDGIKAALAEAVSWIRERYSREEYYRLVFIYTLVSDKKASVAVERVLPPELKERIATLPAKEPPMLYMEAEPVFSGILDDFLSTTLYRCFLESLRSENWYRLQAMEGASENLKRRVVEFRSDYNYVRQEEITEEMLEILGGGMFFRS